MKWILLLSLLFLANLEKKHLQETPPYPIHAEISILNKVVSAQEELKLKLTLTNTGRETIQFCLPRRSLLSKQKTPYVFVVLKSTNQLCGQSLYTRFSELWIPKNKDRITLRAGQKHKLIFNPLEILVDCELEFGDGLKPGKYKIQISAAVNQGCLEASDDLGEKDGKFQYLFKTEELTFEV
ncbi:MAG: hypothetical protein R8P61_05710 [Bacteroidia bacterium]|nr:hypothetical protein [Bacteroidia bacterium]